MLPKEAPVPGTGWGCFQCGLPNNGAIAVICDHCENMLVNGVPVDNLLAFACRGVPEGRGRIPYEQLVGDHRHDMSRHPEAKATDKG